MLGSRLPTAERIGSAGLPAGCRVNLPVHAILHANGLGTKFSRAPAEFPQAMRPQMRRINAPNPANSTVCRPIFVLRPMPPSCPTERPPLSQQVTRSAQAAPENCRKSIFDKSGPPQNRLKNQGLPNLPKFRAEVTPLFASVFNFTECAQSDS